MNLPKSELAIKRDEWFESSAGLSCLGRSILRYDCRQEFLKERLEEAFLAGAKANEEVHAEFAAKFHDLINE